MPDELTQKLKVTVEMATADAIKDLLDLDKNVAKYKQAVLEISEVTKASFKASAASFKKFADLTMGETTALTVAVKELTQEQLKASKNIAQQAKIQTELTKNEEKAKREAIKETVRLEKEAAKAAIQQEKERIAAMKAANQERTRLTRERIARGRLLLEQQRANDKAIEDSAKSTRLFGMELSKIGAVAQVVLGLGIIQIFRSITNFLRSAAEEGLKFAQSMFKLSVSVRALRRRGMDITFSGVLADIKELRKDFVIFTQQEMVDGVAQVQLLTRNFGFTKDQIQDVEKVAASLAIVLGKDFNEAAREVALFLSSGYAESMQRAGMAVNRRVVEEKAHAMGIRKTYLELTEEERALAALAVIMEQSNDLTAEAAEFQKTHAGQIIESQKAVEGLKQTIGMRLTPVYAVLSKFVTKVVNGFTALMGIAGIMAADILKVAIAFKVLVQVLAAVKQGELEAVDAMEVFSEAARQAQDEALRITFPDLFDPITAGLGAALEETEEDLEAMDDVYDESKDAIIDMMEDFSKKLVDINQDLQDDLLKIERDGARRREEIIRNYTKRIEDINKDATRSRAKAERDLARDLAKLDRDGVDRKAEIEARHREKELEAEEKFQEKMRKMRENFLLTLDEAVRARDAKQIRRLSARFQLSKRQAIRDFDLGKKQRDRQFKRELAEAEKQRKDRKKERLIAFNERMADIESQRQHELQEARIDHEEDLADLKRNLAEKREERLRRHQQQLRDLNRHIQDRLKAIARGWTEEINLTIKGAQKVYEALLAYFGPGGYVEKLYDYYNSLGTSPPKPKGGGFAEGGSFVTTGPTRQLFGEAGPELVTALPLTRIGADVGKFFGGLPVPLANSGGSLRLELLLSPDLEARIIENSLGEFSDILVSVERSR